MSSCVKSILALLSLLVLPLSAFASPVTFQTEDGIEISGDIEFPKANAKLRPAVIFIHQGGSDKSEWIETDLYKRVVQQGLVAFSYDVRGHGASTGSRKGNIFNDPNRSPKDLKAALGFLAAQESIDTTRIGIVGSSIGANLALVGLSNLEFDIKTAVAISGKTSAWINLAGGSEAMVPLASAYLIAGEKEQNGKRATWAKEIFDMASEPKALEIVAGSREHGTEIVKRSPELQTRICNWLTTHLKD